jgi:hypothetical protein
MRKLSLASRIGAAVGAIRVVLGAVLLGAGLAGPAVAQCMLDAGPSSFVNPSTFKPYNSTGFTYQVLPFVDGLGRGRLVTGTDWSYGIYDISSPMSPQLVGWDDLNSSIGVKRADGQTYYDRLGVSADGQRFLVSLSSTGSVAHGNTLVFSPGTPLFTPGGDFGHPQAAGAVVQRAGGRYIAYTIARAYNLIAADVTNLPGYTPAGSGDSPSVLNIPSEVTTFPTGDGTRDLTLSDPYLVYLGGGNVVIVDASNPGPPGSIMTGHPWWQLAPTDFGRPLGQGLVTVGAAVDPTSAGNRIYIVGEFASAGSSTGFTLLRFDRSGSSYTTTVLGTFVPPVPFSGAGSLPGLSVALLPRDTDVVAAFWAKTSIGGAGGGRAVRLYATSVRNWSSLTPSSLPVVHLDALYYPTFAGVSQTALLRGTGTTSYAYVATGTSAWVLQMNCLSGPAPAFAQIRVSNVSGGTPVPITSGTTVFVGDSLQVTPLVLPPDSVTPIDQWNLDLDYHAPQETAGGLLRLHSPDFAGNGDPPSSFTLVGPCDRNFASANPATGAGCWASVTLPSGNATFGGPDFPTSPPAGTLATLPIALEAKNSLNDAESPPNLALFDIAWRVPAVKPTGLVLGAISALLSASNTATLQDASEGHPLPTAFTWYFGSDPAGPAGETLAPDPACPGSSCTHLFSSGSGRYNALLRATYKGGYASPPCGPPCTLPAVGSFIVNVTGLVADFTASSSAWVGGAPIGVTNRSQLGQGMTPTYWYTLCDASSASCPEGPYTPLAGGGPWTLPVPLAPGTWWLRMRGTYGSGPTVSQWLPNVVSGAPDVWPIDVRELPPVLKPTAGSGLCTVGGCPASYTGTIGTPMTVAVFRGSQQQTGTYDWQTSGACVTPDVATASPTFVFTPAGAGLLTVSNTTLGISLDVLIGGSPSVTAPSVVGAGSPNRVASVPDHAGSTWAWIVTNGTITAGQGTSRITFTAGTAGTPLRISVTETNPSGCVSDASSATVTVVPRGSATLFYTVMPCRQFDTRSASPLAAGGTRAVVLTGSPCGIPSEATSVSVNVTVAQPTATGFLTVYPADAPRPLSSVINFSAGQTRANGATLRLSGDGTGSVKIFNGGSGPVQVIIDVNGYFW